MSKFVELPIFDKGQDHDVMSFVNIEQIRCFIPIPENKCKIVFDSQTYYIVDKKDEEIRDMLKELGYYIDL